MIMSTLDQLQKHLMSSKVIKTKSGHEYKDTAEAVQCKDGSTMSVQASRTHYCEPRENHGPYTHVEVWFCGTVWRWNEYGDASDPYAYLPIELVVDEIDRRGGIKEQEQ